MLLIVISANAIDYWSNVIGHTFYISMFSGKGTSGETFNVDGNSNRIVVKIDKQGMMYVTVNGAQVAVYDIYDASTEKRIEGRNVQVVGALAKCLDPNNDYEMIERVGIRFYFHLNGKLQKIEINASDGKLILFAK